MQMVALYHDPGGETVFDRSDTTYVPATTISNSDTDTLRKRVKELEAQVAKQQVCNMRTLQWSKLQLE